MTSLPRRPWVTTPLIQDFAKANDAEELSRLADDLGEAGDPEAITVLLHRLGDQKVQDDPDVEDAVCSALVRLGVMEKRGNLNFRFVNRSLLAPAVVTWIDEHRAWVPMKYLAP